MLELDASIGRRKAPIDLDFFGIACLLPSLDLAFELCWIADPLVQGVCREHGEFDLRHVQPTAVFGSIMNLQLLTEALRFLWGKHLIESRWRMRIQVIHHQHDLLGLWIMHVDELTHKFSPIHFRSSPCHLDVALASQRFTGHEEVTDALPFIFVVILFQVSWPWGQSFSAVLD